MRTQTLTLKEGWNAVFLEVEPLDTHPDAIFAGTPVDIAAQFTRHVNASQFVTNPQEILANTAEWSIWYAPDREESLFSGLHALHGHNAFLIHSKADFQWNITGQVYLKRLHWKPDTFNLVGFPVNSAALPTFAQYFEGTPAHASKPVFQLVDGMWRKVQSPATTPMRRGEAYWVYCEGGSDFQGPSDVSLSFGDHLRFSRDVFHSKIVLRNRSPHPESITITQVANQGAPLEIVFKGILETEVQTFSAELPETYPMPSMEAGVAGSLTLQLASTANVEAGGTNLLRISSDAGSEYWLAVFIDPEG